MKPRLQKQSATARKPPPQKTCLTHGAGSRFKITEQDLRTGDLRQSLLLFIAPEIRARGKIRHVRTTRLQHRQLKFGKLREGR
jgi:hypothetical protein